MAITILQQPTSPNVTGTNLIYSVSSSNVPQFQFRYIADLYYSGSATRLARFKYPQNSSNTVNIDLARPIGDYLDTDYNWKITNSSSFDNSVKEFDIKFGEEYGTSYTSPVTEFTNEASASIEVFQGNVYPSQFTNGFNWTPQSLLTNSPTTQSFNADDYLTAAVYNTDVSVKYYLTGSLTATKNYVSTGKFSAIPISPLNISNYTESDAIVLNVTGSSIRYELGNYCQNEKQRFAFTNKFGFWDYYNVYMPTLKSTKIDRKMYEQDNPNLNNRIAQYNVSNRGEKQYYTEYTDEFEITTDTLDDKESQWLREMFESTDVYIQSGSDFIPIVITNTSEQISNNKYRNKNFRYTIRYQFSNLREPR